MCSHCEGSHPTENTFKQQRNYKGHKKFSSSFNSQNFKISALNVMAGRKIQPSDVYQRIAGFQIF